MIYYPNSFMIAEAALLAIIAVAGHPSHCVANTNVPHSAEEEFNLANRKMIWGQKTNFVVGKYASGSWQGPLEPLPTILMLGLNARDGEIVLSGKRLKVRHPADVHLFTDSDHGYAFVCIPPGINETLLVSLTDSNGVPVPKTKKGLALGQRFALEQGTTWFRWTTLGNPWVCPIKKAPWRLVLIASDREQYAGRGSFVFDPAQYFEITTPGPYLLTMGFNILVVDTNWCLKPISLPPVMVNVRVDNKS